MVQCVYRHLRPICQTAANAQQAQNRHMEPETRTRVTTRVAIFLDLRLACDLLATCLQPLETWPKRLAIWLGTTSSDHTGNDPSEDRNRNCRRV